MSRYTATLRELAYTFGEDEVLTWFSDYNLEHFLDAQQIKVITDKGTWTKERLASKIYDHFYMREIGLETPGLFKHRVKVKMKRIMEEKLPLIYSASIQYDPLVNVDFTEYYSETHKDDDTATNQVNSSSSSSSSDNSTANSSNNTTNNSSGLQINSDTPQGQIQKSSILAGNYASSTVANENSGSEMATQNATSTNTNTASGEAQESSDYNRGNTGSKDYTLHKVGNDGITASVQNLIKQYREIIVAIDDQIIDELESLFMGIY